MESFSEILDAADQGDRKAADQLLPLVYTELRRLAARQLANETPGQTLDPTALVHEAYLRLAAGSGQAEEGSQPRWKDSSHFLAAAAEAMRRILIENARRKKSLRHGGGRRRILLADIPADGHPPEVLIALDDALGKLAFDDAEAAAVVKLRFYAGLSVSEAGHALGISRAQAYRHWAYGCAWLRSALGEDGSGQV